MCDVSTAMGLAKDVTISDKDCLQVDAICSEFCGQVSECGPEILLSCFIERVSS